MTARLFKVWSADRTARTFVCASALEELIDKGCLKLGYNRDQPLAVVLEDDGTFLDSDECFQLVPEESKFLLLRQHERWTEPVTQGYFAVEVQGINHQILRGRGERRGQDSLKILVGLSKQPNPIGPSGKLVHWISAFIQSFDLKRLLPMSYEMSGIIPHERSLPETNMAAIESTPGDKLPLESSVDVSETNLVPRGASKTTKQIGIQCTPTEEFATHQPADFSAQCSIVDEELSLEPSIDFRIQEGTNEEMSLKPCVDFVEEPQSPSTPMEVQENHTSDIPNGQINKTRKALDLSEEALAQSDPGKEKLPETFEESDAQTSQVVENSPEKVEEESVAQTSPVEEKSPEKVEESKAQTSPMEEKLPEKIEALKVADISHVEKKSPEKAEKSSSHFSTVEQKTPDKVEESNVPQISPVKQKASEKDELAIAAQISPVEQKASEKDELTIDQTSLVGQKSPEKIEESDVAQISPMEQKASEKVESTTDSPMKQKPSDKPEMSHPEEKPLKTYISSCVEDLKESSRPTKERSVCFPVEQNMSKVYYTVKQKPAYIYSEDSKSSNTTVVPKKLAQTFDDFKVEQKTLGTSSAYHESPKTGIVIPLCFCAPTKSHKGPQGSFSTNYSPAMKMQQRETNFIENTVTKKNPHMDIFGLQPTHLDTALASDVLFLQAPEMAYVDGKETWPDMAFVKGKEPWPDMAYVNGKETRPDMAYVKGKEPWHELRDLTYVSRYMQKKKGTVRFSPLMETILKRDVTAAKLIIDKGNVDVNERGPHGATALILACATGSLEMVEGLLQNGANVNAYDLKGNSPLIVALLGHHEALAEQCIYYSAKIEHTNLSGKNALHIAAMNGCKDIVQSLLDRGSDVNSRDMKQWTPLMLCAQKDDRSGTLQLLDNFNANIDAENEAGRTALEIASASGENYNVNCLIKAGSDVNHVNKEGGNALILATIGDHLAVVINLIKNGAKVGHRDKLGRTALFYACFKGHKDIVNALLEPGGIKILAIPDNEGNTALMCAKKRGHMHIVSILKAYGARFSEANLSSSDQETSHHASSITERSLLDACAINDQDKILKLVAEGTNVRQRDKNGMSALMLCAGYSELATVYKLINAGAQVNDSDVNGTTPLMVAACSGNPNVLGVLLNNGADVNVTHITGGTALHGAAKQGHDTVISRLINAGADVNIQDSNGWSPLMFAADTGNGEALILLINARADLHLRSSRGVTALHLCARQGHHEAVEILLQAGVILQYVDENGQFAWDYAIEKGFPEIAQRLLLVHEVEHPDWRLV